MSCRDTQRTNFSVILSNVFGDIFWQKSENKVSDGKRDVTEVEVDFPQLFQIFDFQSLKGKGDQGIGNAL